jgi:hypothetical protein
MNRPRGRSREAQFPCVDRDPLYQVRESVSVEIIDSPAPCHTACSRARHARSGNIKIDQLMTVRAFAQNWKILSNCVPIDALARDVVHNLMCATSAGTPVCTQQSTLNRQTCRTPRDNTNVSDPYFRASGMTVRVTRSPSRSTIIFTGWPIFTASSA